MLIRVLLAAVFAMALAAPAAAQTPPPSPPSGAAAALLQAAAAGQQQQPIPYEIFIRNATIQDGLIPIIHKSGRIYLALNRSQLGQDFIETSVPSSGLGGLGPAQGEPYVAPARVIRFEKVDENVVIRWPNTYARVRPNTPEALGVQQTLPSSVIAVAPIAAFDEETIVIPASAFLGDVADFEQSINRGGANPLGGYRLDPTRSFFAQTKAFPQNDVLRVDQTWQGSGTGRLDNAPDARSIEVLMTYNIIQAPSDGYMPRIADPRVGYFAQPLINFSTDQLPTGRTIHYISRWNFGRRTSSAPFRATNPLVFYLSNDIPYQYRDTVRAALLTWNNAFRRIGILNAVQVAQQPTDPAWDPEDIRHNMIRWLDTSSPAFGAEALLVTDPRSGEELNIGVNFDAVEGLAGRTYRYVIAPARGIPDTQAGEHQYVQQLIRSVILHESGHDFGLQHNFIGTMAYSAKQMQSKAFTSRYGVANSVMEYSPLNVWPKGTPQGDYVQLVLGPYDYHAIQYGYAFVPAGSPEGELPTLGRWASSWANPMLRFASDEDTQFSNGHAIDPRVQTYDLTNKPLQWCGVQMAMMHRIMNAVANRFPQRGHSFDEARVAFTTPMTTYLRCAQMAAHTIGGEYLSRSANGDPGSTVPLSAVSRTDNRAAWNMLANGLFSESAWHFNPNVLTRLTYSEYSSLGVGATWAYNPTPRHDVAIVSLVNAAQDATLNELFAPLLLQRVDDLPTKYSPKSTITITDLFDWTRDGIFGDIPNGRVASAGPIRRNLQMMFAKRLADMWVNPEEGTPADAQALARVQLELLRHNVALGLAHNVDELTRAHLEALGAVAQQALEARANILSAPAAVPAFRRGGSENP